MLEVSRYGDMPHVYDESDPANSESAMSLDDQIKAYEAIQAAQSRQRSDYTSYEKEKVRHQGVCFADEALLYSSDRTVDEVKQMWYSRDELAEFKNERKHIVKVLKKANFDLVAVERTGRYCLRGYEPYFSMEVNKAMKYARTLVANLVMAEQDRQRTSGYLDDDALRQSCCGASQWARDNALQLGQNDEYEVYGDYGEEEQTYADQSADCTNDEYEPQIHYAEYPVQQQYENELCAESHHSILGKRKEEVPQPEFTPRARAPAEVVEETSQSKDPLAERLDCALKLVQALKFGSAAGSH